MIASNALGKIKADGSDSIDDEQGTDPNLIISERLSRRLKMFSHIGSRGNT